MEVELFHHRNSDLMVQYDKFFSSDYSELISIIGLGMNRSVKLFRLPKALLKFLGFILMRQNQINRLIGSLQIDNSYAKEILNWTPPVSVKEGIRRMFQGK